jgi:hypothetical protein
MQVFVDQAGNMFIGADDHRRICEALLAMATPFGTRVHDPLRVALLRGRPASGDPREAARHFGLVLPAIQETIRPLVGAIGEMVEGFDTWLAVTGWGNDKDFIEVLLTWARALGDLGAPRGRDRSRLLASLAPPPRIPAALAGNKANGHGGHS